MTLLQCGCGKCGLRTMLPGPVEPPLVLGDAAETMAETPNLAIIALAVCFLGISAFVVVIH